MPVDAGMVSKKEKDGGAIAPQKTVSVYCKKILQL